jgi:Flp pilus assembly protein TadG
MRVTSRRDENGAVAVFVAICAVLLFAGAAYAIDAGHLWSTRRHIIEGADAGSLAAAGTLATGGSTSNACGTVAPDYIASNVDDAVLVECDVAGEGEDRGRVTVQARTSFEYTFAGILGADDRDVSAITTSEWGIPTGVVGLRPFGLCLDANEELRDWLNLPTGPSGPSDEITIVYNKAQPDACGPNVPGNWGVLDFDGGNNSNSDTKDWTLNGYPGEVALPSDVPGNPGAFSNSLQSELQTLEDSDGYFALPIFDAASGNGSNGSFHVIAAVYVRLIDFKANGAEKDRYMTLVFDRGVLEGSCCGGTLDTGVRSLRICDVDTLAPDTSDPRAC